MGTPQAGQRHLPAPEPGSEAAKCLILIVKIARRITRYVPGDRRVDINAIRTLFAARYVGFCDAATAERLAHAVPAHFVASSLRGML